MSEPQNIAWIDAPGYQGPDRRLHDRRDQILPEDRDWRISNLALIGSDQRGTLGRRANDYALLAGL